MFNKTVQMIAVALMFSSPLSNAEERVFDKVESFSIINLSGDIDLMPYSGNEISISSANLNDYDFSQQNGELTL
jgi:hypothetical protein